MDDKRVVEPDALERILGGPEKPGSISLQLLQDITGNFSENQIIGRGGCGVVYKGILPNGVVAVKKLLDCHTIDEKMFLYETATMKKVGHQNIVRFLGYCSESQDKVVEVNGKPVTAEKRERLLCFEYIRKGSLDKYLDDELRGLEWQTRYQIIKGICDGLLHLHEKKKILHMDLKPSNVLLDDQMLPKITDFGLARTLDTISQTTSAQYLSSPGYSAPEYIDSGKRSWQADIYSLGVIIIELVTGSKKVPNTTKVLRRWRHRWNKSSKYSPLWYHQVKKCLDLAVRCMEKDPVNRPYIWIMINELTKIENWDDDQIKAATESSLGKIISGLDDMLWIDPLQFHFPLAHKNPISCCIELTNNTDYYYAFRIATTSVFRFSIQPNEDIAVPRSKCRATITLPVQEISTLQDHSREELIVQSTKVGGGLTAKDITIDMFKEKGGNSHEKIDEVNKMVDEVTVFFDMEPLPTEIGSQEFQQSMELLAHPVHKDSRLDVRHVEPDALERIIGGQERPGSLDFRYLQHITGNFSNDRLIGKGGSAYVYKGMLPNGVVVAVKKLLYRHTSDDKMFHREVRSIIKVRHQNVVRFLGYCSETKEKAIEIDGKVIMAEERERLLCFEYVRKGSLENYLTDELRGLEWHKRYQIIKGICDGLLYLHKEEHILHMHLKPSNILLGDQMLPKITDFGLAALDGKSQTTAEFLVSPGYYAPEYLMNGKISWQADIYSLGVIIMELVAGSKGMPNRTKVLRRWRHRWNKSSKHTPLWYLQVKTCLELAARCRELDPINRPYIEDIISELSELDSWDGDQIKAATESSLDKIISGSDDMLGIEPLESELSLSHEKPSSCSIELTNDTDNYMAFRIGTPSALFSIEPNKGIAAPRSKCRTTIYVTLPAEWSLEYHIRKEIIVESTKVGGGLTATDITADMFNEWGKSQKTIDEVDKMVDEVTVVFHMQPLRAEMGPQEVQRSSTMELLTRFGHKDSRYIKDLQRILNGSESPSQLPLSLLQGITENFSDERKITNNGPGAVYKGIIGNQIVTVKRLSHNDAVDDWIFEQTIEAMMMVKHQNILRLLGYCSNTEEQAIEVREKINVAEEQERLLCFEYASNGSLDQHLTDELRGLEWHTRYRIILGICEGLQHLHNEKHIIDVDLKTSDMLLGDHMVPKITGFGLSRFEEKSQTMNSERILPLGYGAPKDFNDSRMSDKTDIYSLGTIIIELVTGRRDKANISNVLRRWRHRWNKSAIYMPLWEQQVTKCLELALSCMHVDPKQRPCIRDIIHELKESEPINYCSDDMLGIEPLEIHFVSELDTQQSRSIQFTNDTDHYIAFMISPPMHRSLAYSTQPNKDVVPPRSKYSVTITLEAYEDGPGLRDQFTVLSIRVEEGVKATDISDEIFNEVEGKVVDKVDVILETQ